MSCDITSTINETIMELKTKIKILLVLLLLGAFETYGQKNLAVMEFEDELCLYKGYYDKDKYTEQQLKNSHQLTMVMLYFSGDNLNQLRENYEDLKKKLTDLRLVNQKVFLDARDSMLRYIDESYEIQQLRIKAEDDPKVLFCKFQENEKVKKYTEALNQDEGLLLKAYEDLTKEQMENNAYPEGLWRKYQANIQREDRYEIAFDYVLTYGWWNQVNRLIYHYPHDGSIGEFFFKLFEKVVTIDCDEP